MSSANPIAKSERVTRSCKLTKSTYKGQPLYIVSWKQSHGYTMRLRYQTSELTEQEIAAFEDRLANRSRILMDITDENKPGFAHLDPVKAEPKRDKRMHEMPPQYLPNGFIDPNWLRVAETRRTLTWTQWAERYWARS